MMTLKKHAKTSGQFLMIPTFKIHHLRGNSKYTWHFSDPSPFVPFGDITQSCIVLCNLFLFPNIALFMVQILKKSKIIRQLFFFCLVIDAWCLFFVVVVVVYFLQRCCCIVSLLIKIFESGCVRLSSVRCNSISKKWWYHRNHSGIDCCYQTRPTSWIFPRSGHL